MVHDADLFKPSPNSATMDKHQLVRAFTDSLDDCSVLAAGTKEAQRELDTKIEKRARLRRERLLRDLDLSSE